MSSRLASYLCLLGSEVKMRKSTISCKSYVKVFSEFLIPSPVAQAEKQNTQILKGLAMSAFFESMSQAVVSEMTIPGDPGATF